MPFFVFIDDNFMMNTKSKQPQRHQQQQQQSIHEYIIKNLLSTSFNKCDVRNAHIYLFFLFYSQAIKHEKQTHTHVHTKIQYIFDIFTSKSNTISWTTEKIVSVHNTTLSPTQLCRQLIKLRRITNEYTKTMFNGYSHIHNYSFIKVKKKIQTHAYIM